MRADLIMAQTLDAIRYRTCLSILLADPEFIIRKP